MKTETAGPALRALLAANVHRFLPQIGRATEGRLGDHSRAGVFRDELDGVTVITTNYINVSPPDVESRLTWEIKHPLWVLSITDRRLLTDDGSFVRSAPFEASLEGDMVDAARFLQLPRELFFMALRGDGWTSTELTIEQLRWIDGPYVVENHKANAILRLL